MTIVQAPQTSSRQLQSQATGATFLPSAVVAWAAIRCSTLMTFISGSYGDPVPLPIAGLAGAVLAEDADLERSRGLAAWLVAVVVA